MSERIRVGVSEAAHVTTKVKGSPLPNQKYILPLSARVQNVESMGFTAYEAMPTPSTAVSTLFLRQGRIARVQDMVVNIHSPWTDDRRVHPEPAETDSRLQWKLRSVSSERMSASDWTDATMQRLAKETNASISTHWPHYVTRPVDSLSQRENGRRETIQSNLDMMNAVIVAENHVLIGMTDEEMHIWLEYPRTFLKPRGFAFVSGTDVRNKEYAGQSSVDPMKHLPFVRGVYIKEGWRSETLLSDLRAVRESGNEHDLWVMVNYSGGVNKETAHQLREIVEKVNAG